MNATTSTRYHSKLCYIILPTKELSTSMLTQRINPAQNENMQKTESVRKSPRGGGGGGGGSPKVTR